jgi:hypothetical protein
MKIENFVCADFLGIKAARLGLKTGVHLFAGENGQGKSSVRDSISWGLTGVVRGLKKNKDYASVVRNGAKRAEVAFDLSHGGKVLKIDKKRTKSTFGGNSEKEVADFLSVSPGAIAACLDAWAFGLMSKAEREAIIKAVFGGAGAGAGEIEAVLVEYGFTEKYNSWIIKNIQGGADISAVHELAVAERIAAKRLLAGIEPPEEIPETVEIGGQAQKISLLVDKDIESPFAGRIPAYQKKRDELLQKAGSLKAGADLPGKRSALVARMNAFKAERFTDAHEKELAELRGELIDRDKKISGNNRLIADTSAKAAGRAKNTACPAPLVSGVNICPGCDGFSDTDRELVAGMRQENSKLVEEKERIASLERYERAFNEILAELDEIDALITAGGNVDVSAEIAEVEREIAELAVRIDNSRAADEAIKEFFRARDAGVAAENAKAGLKAEVEAWDKVAACLSVDGIRQKLNSGGVSLLNGRLEKSFVMVGFGFRVDDDYEPVIADGRPFQLLSTSEKWRVGAAIAEAIAYHSGLRFFCLDECDLLVQASQGRFVSWVLSLSPDYDQIFIFASAKESPKPTPIENLYVWHVVDGRVAPVINQKAV